MFGASLYFMTGAFVTAAVSTGPCVVVGELDQQDIDAETRVNGVVRQSYNTSEMIWSFGEVLEYLSQDFTFVPGDVIAGGTSAQAAPGKNQGHGALDA